ncbi:MAG: biotin transporter BioY [Pseudomonadota bacterium]
MSSTESKESFRARNPLSLSLGLIATGALLLTVSSYIAVPIGSVPITMQTLAVTSIGALYGWRLGAGTVLIWLALGALGLPVFSGGSGGVQHLSGATAGYLWAFPVAAGVTGVLVARGWDADHKAWAFAAMGIGNLICLTLGAGWLAGQIGFDRAIEVGFAPFLPGAGVKAGLGVGVLMAARRLGWRDSRNGPEQTSSFG